MQRQALVSQVHRQLTRHVAKDRTALLWSGDLQRTAATTKLVSNLQQDTAVSAHYAAPGGIMVQRHGTLHARFKLQN